MDDMEAPAVLIVEYQEMKRVDATLFWYDWGGRLFDIRYLRELVGLPPISAQDFCDGLPVAHVLKVIQPVLDRSGDKTFSQLLDLHDASTPFLGQWRSFVARPSTA